MTNLRKLTSAKIYFFENDGKQAATNTLKEFIYFLKFTGRTNIDFSYAAERDSLHQELNIKENFELDSIPSSLIKDSENNVLDFLNQLENPHLKELITELGDLNRKVKNLNSKEVKLTAVIKAILSMSEFIFLEAPESNITANTLNKIKDCIQFEAVERERTVLIKSSRRILWPDVITNIISKNESHQYINTKNPLNHGLKGRRKKSINQRVPLKIVS